MSKNQYYLTVIGLFCFTLMTLNYFNRPLILDEEAQGTYLVDTIMLDVDALDFSDAFKICRLSKGPEATFIWRGAWYTTQWKKGK